MATELHNVSTWRSRYRTNSFAVKCDLHLANCLRFSLGLDIWVSLLCRSAPGVALLLATRINPTRYELIVLGEKITLDLC